MGAGVQCIKYLLFIFNLFIALGGLGLVVIGCLFIFGLSYDVVQWIDIKIVADILQNKLLESAVYIVTGAGGLVFLIAVCGCLGAIVSSKCLLGLYFVFLMIIVAAQLTAGYLAEMYGGEVTKYLADEGKVFLKYKFDDSDSSTGLNKTISESWNTFQTTFDCCGVDGKEDYPVIPDSCCMGSADMAFVKGSCGNAVTPFKDGCQSTLEDLVMEYETILAASAFGVACFEFFCIMFAICLCINIRDDDD